MNWLGTSHNAIMKSDKQVAEVLAFNQYFIIRYEGKNEMKKEKFDNFNDMVKFLNKHFKGWTMP